MSPLLDEMVSAAMPQARFDLEIPKPKMLTSKEELELARKAFERNPQSLPLLYSFAGRLVYLDRFQEAIDILHTTDAGDFLRYMYLYNAYIGFETGEATLKAREAATKALALADSPRRRAIALGNIAKTHTRFQEIDRAVELLREALEAEPENKDAYKRLVRIYLHQSPQKALDFAYEMVARGVLHARVLGSIPLILARMGRFEEAHQFEALNEFLISKVPAAPEGWESLEAFNKSLAAEILNHPDMRYGRYGTASSKTWRVDEPSLMRSKVFPHLQRLIRDEVMAYVQRMDSDHPLARAIPARASLRNWCVVTEGEGHETWHVHQNGWMSGVYYIHIQDHIATGTTPEGCLIFGISDEIAGKEAAAGYGERIVRPHTGLMMMFPSYSFHKTCPHHGDGYRICFAFDIIPVTEE